MDYQIKLIYCHHLYVCFTQGTQWFNVNWYEMYKIFSSENYFERESKSDLQTYQ